MNKQSYAQHGEDLRVAAFFGRDYRGVFLEIGANAPKWLSQTCLLEQMGWSGVLVEPNATLAQALREQRPNSQVFEAAVSDPAHVGTAYLHMDEGGDSGAQLVFADDPQRPRPAVQVRTLDAILDDARITAIDFMSIDIEGHEIPALRGFSFERFRPRLIIIEDRVHDLSRHRFLTGKGYRLVDRTGCNGWYLRQDLVWTLRSHASWLSRLRKYYLCLPFRMWRHRKSRNSNPA